ncbi:MAG TPA: ABC transporter permease [Gammaproteobacteria bacterium]|nr:ABC transporter permease [Gammaproteobacteria bacterium]|tara:strand:+ start:3518 stop:4555 length:1038 start_codon:yes stop_codon:yes gene_type:complete
MSTLSQRRWQQFRDNKRAYRSAVLFLILFTISLFAEFVANDKPILMYHKGEFWTPVLADYTERELGGEMETAAVYWDPYVQDLVAESGGWMVWPPIPYSYKTADMYLAGPAPMAPNSRHWLGTDDAGKDTLARLIYGFRISVLFGLLLTLISSAIGVAVGAVQGYFGGLVDLLGQRLVEIWSGLPILVILIILASIVEPSFFWLLGCLAAFSWMSVVAVVRAEFLRTRNFEYVRAAKALGDHDLSIMVRHVLPNAMTAALTFLPFILSGAITALTALDFLGFGLPAGSASLGELLNQGKRNLQAPWLGITGFVTVGLMLTLLIFVGEGIRDAFDPRKTLTRSTAD